MRRFFALFAFVLLAAAGVSVSCGPKVVPVTGVTLDKETLQLYVGESSKITPTVLPAGATDVNVNWRSDATDIVSVDKWGHLKGLKPGKATITAITQDGGLTASCEVTVVDYFSLLWRTPRHFSGLEGPVPPGESLLVSVPPSFTSDFELWFYLSADGSTQFPDPYKTHYSLTVEENPDGILDSSMDIVCVDVYGGTYRFYFIKAGTVKFTIFYDNGVDRAYSRTITLTLKADS